MDLNTTWTQEQQDFKYLRFLHYNRLRACSHLGLYDKCHLNMEDRFPLQSPLQSCREPQLGPVAIKRLLVSPQVNRMNQFASVRLHVGK